MDPRHPTALDYVLRTIDDGPSPDLDRAFWRYMVALAIACGLLLWLIHRPAEAQQAINRPPVCGTAEQMDAELAKYGEHPVALGVSGNSSLVALYVDDDDGSWTLVERMPTNPPVTCLLRAGEAWQGREIEQGAPT